MVSIDLYKNLPTSDELPDSDDTPVDNEDQKLSPQLPIISSSNYLERPQ
ncbi:hypothetical protein SPLC1_S532380 [Arthrospira platensis C1]|nr:hypothetical protein SPLC1_S532380 [Arthrospira platensis C1]